MHCRLSCGADLVQRPFLRQQGAEGAGLGHAPAVLQHDPAFRIGLQQGAGAGGATDADGDEAGEICGPELRQLAGKQEVRRYTEAMADRQISVGQQIQEMQRVEGPHDDVRTANMEDAVGEELQAADVEDRQEGEIDGMPGQFALHRGIHGIVECLAVGHACALGPPRGPRGIDQRPGVIVGHLSNGALSVGPGQSPFVVAVRAIGTADQVRGAAGAGDGLTGVHEFRADDQRTRVGIADDEFQFGHGESPVQRQEDRADPPTGELDLIVVSGIVRQHRNPVAATDTAAIGKEKRTAINPFIHLAIAEPPR